MNSTFKIFVSYSHNDEKHLRQIEKQLSTLRRNGVITDWNDRKIMPGQEWDRKVKSELENADIILLLVSCDFLYSDYSHDIEVQRALKKHYDGDAITIPIIVDFCDWMETPIGRLLALPKNGEPITSAKNPAEAYFSIIEGIKKIIADKQNQDKTIQAYNLESQSMRGQREEIDINRLKGATGLENFVEFLRDSKYHPKNIISTITTNFSFWGHGASKWTNEISLLDKAIERVLVNSGNIEVMIFNPIHTEEVFEKEKILKSILVLEALKAKYNKRQANFMEVKVYADLPSFRLAFINHELVLVGHYKTYTANSNESPILVFNSREDWSFYSAFKTLFKEKFGNARSITSIWDELIPEYKKTKIKIELPKI